MYESFCSMSELKTFQEIDGEYRGPKCVVCFGVNLPPMGLDSNFQSALPKFSSRPDDVWVSSYPKSGTMWLSEIVWQIQNNGSTSDIKINKRVPFFEGSKLVSDGDPTDDRPALDAHESPRIIHSHLPYSLIPMNRHEETQSRYIYIARNPKDTVVSYFHFMESFEEDMVGFKGPFEFMAKIFLEGKVHYGLWHEHVLEWWRHQDCPNILFLKYEDLKKDLEGGVRKVAHFLNKSLPDETISHIAKQCTFQEMAKNPSRYWVFNKDGPKVIRKGEIGDWKHYFTPELNEAFQDKMLAKLDGTGLEFDFEP